MSIFAARKAGKETPGKNTFLARGGGCEGGILGGWDVNVTKFMTLALVPGSPNTDLGNDTNQVKPCDAGGPAKAGYGRIIELPEQMRKGCARPPESCRKLTRHAPELSGSCANVVEQLPQVGANSASIG